MRIFALAPILAFLAGALADPSGSGSLTPPSLQPLVNRANELLSSGQFQDAAMAYSEAIEMSPADYVLYYKRATAYYSLNRHSSALDDFEKVLSLTSNSFDHALLMKAKIHMKDGQWAQAREALNGYTAKVGHDAAAQELEHSLADGEAAAKKAAQAKRAQLWTACAESATQALRTASYATDIRELRAECSLAAGDIEGAVGDLSRLTHLSTPSASSFMRIFRIAYFLLPPPTSSQSPAMTALKQCLHSDPDSKQCLQAHRLVKKFDKAFSKLDQLMNTEDWKGIMNLLLGKNGGFLKDFDEALEANTSREQLLLSPSNAVPLPKASNVSPRRQTLIRALCRASTRSSGKTDTRWCDELLTMAGGENDVDALTAKGEALLKAEEWEEAVRVFEHAFEASGRSSRDVHQRLQRAQKLLKQSKQKDYYKILGVSRDADTKTIRKAFRKAAMTAHPDKGGSEAKMAAVNEAYEVLTDPELRQRFDNGDDPNDPTGGQQAFYGSPFGPGGGHGNPFQQFFQQQGGHPGGFAFKFGGGRH